MGYFELAEEVADEATTTEDRALARHLFGLAATLRSESLARSACLALAGDVGDVGFCRQVIDRAVAKFGRLDILVNNAAEQHPQESIEKITPEQLERTFRTNIFSYFYLTQAAVPHLKEGAAIINTASVTAYRGSPKLLDYSATKGVIVAFTRSLSLALIERGNSLLGRFRSQGAAENVTAGAAKVRRERLFAVLNSEFAVQLPPTSEVRAIRIDEHTIDVEDHGVTWHRTQRNHKRSKGR